MTNPAAERYSRQVLLKEWGDAGQRALSEAHFVVIGAGGIGYLAVVYGYQRFDNHIMIATIVALIATIQLIQFLGDRLVNRLRHTQGNLV